MYPAHPGRSSAKGPDSLYPSPLPVSSAVRLAGFEGAIRDIKVQSQWSISNLDCELSYVGRRGVIIMIFDKVMQYFVIRCERDRLWLPPR